MTWERQEITTACDSCRAYWNTLQDLGAEWDAAGRPIDPDGWGQQIASALAMYGGHLAHHLDRSQP
ncbi:hypothetical protein [Streptomyces qinglanensis]|uniref:Uncharacterized protein n=1 Tax=Streptomyces qinglanensis TaxID=943816 RepID=A0A1H9U3B0_9ACTN|nr:hypothetical protein [Streptomyces qinglanensis]SES03926.1 hypothetical protein SAMN05421870_107286 [Streptomyces qinglanensis]